MPTAKSSSSVLRMDTHSPMENALMKMRMKA